MAEERSAIEDLSPVAKTMLTPAVLLGPLLWVRLGLLLVGGLFVMVTHR